MNAHTEQNSVVESEDQELYSGMTATYSPDDNKLRLYSLARLDAETYARAREHGFKWAPMQKLFVAPMWTPEREDFLIELCGEVGDEDKSLTERAEERADRFGEYSDRRAGDAESARRAVRAIADHIPFGQPILVGHHSERRARKDAERIETGMRRAISLWETSAYWTRRAAGALRNAKYKERADVRYRRIKGIETDHRKIIRGIEEAERFTKQWQSDNLTLERAVSIANLDHISMCFTLDKYPRGPEASQYEGMMSLWAALTEKVIHAEQARDIATRAHARYIERATRWRNHYENRLAYERAMLGETGGIAAEQFNIEVGGMVLIGSEWVTVVRITKRDGAIVSLTTNRRYVRIIGIEEVKDYRAPSEEQKAAATAAAKVPPLCNYPGEGFVHLTQAQFDTLPKDYRGTNKISATDSAGAHRIRSASSAFLRKFDATVKQWDYPSIFITDAKRKDPPLAGQGKPPTASLPREAVIQAAQEKPVATTEPTDFETMRQQLNAGVKVVTASQLFATPYRLAGRMMDFVEMPTSYTPRLLEPSAGTGRLLEALPGVLPFPGQRQTLCEVVAIELNGELAQHLSNSGLAQKVIHGDFLELSESELGTFDRVVMNPPFENAVDIKHIKKAASLLNAGGVLVAICANGPRQQDALKGWAESSGGYWEQLPVDAFAAEGTNVRTAMLVYRAP